MTPNSEALMGTASAESAGVAEAALVREAAEVGHALLAQGLMICTAESCTGGAIARALTDTAGSSAWFDRGFVTYSNDAKQRMLGVAEATLIAHGAVSEPTAEQMARGALRASAAHVAVAVTGIAGPGGAVPGKPVGTVCFGWAVRSDTASDAIGVRVQTVRFGGDRQAVRAAAARHALAGVAADLASMPARA
jgi:nicotinamide-nucleotide amidase